MSDTITDLSLIKIFTERQVYERYVRYVRKELLEPETRILLDDFGAYFEEFQDESIDLKEFPTWFHHYRHPDISE
jgi:hypothetical protein